MAIKKDGKWVSLAGGAQVPKIQPTLSHHANDSASIPRMQAVNNGGQDIKKGASVPKMTPVQAPSGPTNSNSHQGSNNQTAKPGGDKKR